MTQSPVLKNGLNALLTPEESVLVLIDHQAFQFANLHSHEPTMIVNNVVALAKTAKVFNVPTILTTVLEVRGGKLIKPLQDVFPEQNPIDRTFINTWEDSRVVDAVKKTGRKKVIMAALWSEICLAMPDPGRRRRLRGLRRHRCVRRRERRGSRDGCSPHGYGRRRSDHMDGGGGRVTARLGASGTGRGVGRGFPRARRGHRPRAGVGAFRFSARRQAPGRSPAHCDRSPDTQTSWSKS